MLRHGFALTPANSKLNPNPPGTHTINGLYTEVHAKHNSANILSENNKHTIIQNMYVEKWKISRKHTDASIVCENWEKNCKKLQCRQLPMWLVSLLTLRWIAVFTQRSRQDNKIYNLKVSLKTWLAVLKLLKSHSFDFIAIGFIYRTLHMSSM